MVIKGHGEDQGHHKQYHQHARVIGADDQQKKEAHDEDHEFGGHDVREDRAHKKPVLALEKRETVWAVMPNMKRLCGNSGFATGGTT